MSGGKWLGRTAIALSLGALSLGTVNTSAAWAFSDTATYWGRACIDQLSQRKLVNGYPNGTFRPDAPVTRAEFAVLMLNAFPNTPRSRTAPAFRDVPRTYWAYRAIRDAAERQFFSGYPDGTFQPTQPIPRVQAIAIVTNALKHPAPNNPEQLLRQYFTDAAQIPSYARGAIAAGTLNRLVVNYPQLRQLRPNQGSTRGEVAALLCQAVIPESGVPKQYIAGSQNLFAIPPSVGGFQAFSQGLTVVSANAKFGYIDTTGKLAIAPRFDSALPFSEDLAAAAVRQPDGEARWGYINRQGQWVIEPRLINVTPFSEGLAAVRVGVEPKYGFIDKTGKLVIPAQYDAVLPFTEGLAAAQLNQQWGYINPQGQWVIQPQSYTAVTEFSEGMARVEQNIRVGFIDKTGKLVIPLQYANAEPFAEGLAAVRTEESRWGYMDKSGKWVIQPQFFQAQSFSEGLAGVRLGDKWGFINPQGAIAIPAQFYLPKTPTPSGDVEPYSTKPVLPFTEGLAVARLGEKAGFIDKTGQFVIAPQFADATSFSEGLARVNVGGRWVTRGPGPEGPYEAGLEDGEWGYIRTPSR